MDWSELYGAGDKPALENFKQFISSDLWDELNIHIQREYSTEPKLFYSGCSMDKCFWKGWNVKYKKSGKPLCTLYPKQGYFVALITVSVKEVAEADLLIPLCDEYTQSLYSQTKFGAFGKSLAVEVTNENILRDAKNLIALRSGSRKI